MTSLELRFVEEDGVLAFALRAEPEMRDELLGQPGSGLVFTPGYFEHVHFALEWTRERGGRFLVVGDHLSRREA